jgi:tetratricopeptide (TPR) repeat protein
MERVRDRSTSHAERFSHHSTWLPIAVTLAVLAAILAGVPRAPAASVRPHSLPEPVVVGNVVSPPFLGWDESARQTFLRNESHSTYPAEIHYDLGLYFYEKGLYELSLQHYQKSVELDPKFAEAHFGMGLLFYTLGDDENAIKQYRTSIDCDPHDADTRNNLGLIYYRRGEMEAADREISEALRLQPNFPDACYNLGLVRYKQKDLDGAIALFLRALSYDPSYHRARFNLGVAYFEMGKSTLAQEQWQRILDAAPGTTIAEQAQENLSIVRGEAK